jgi:hypothetical protein
MVPQKVRGSLCGVCAGVIPGAPVAGIPSRPDNKI